MAPEPGFIELYPIGPGPIGPVPFRPVPIGPGPFGPVPIGPGPIGPTPVAPVPKLPFSPIAPQPDCTYHRDERNKFLVNVNLFLEYQLLSKVR